MGRAPAFLNSMNFLKRTALVLSLMSGACIACAQGFVWDIGFGLRFDNREYAGMDGVPSETVFGARLMPQAGLEWADADKLSAPSHRLMIGGDVMATLGARVTWCKPLFYYRYDSRILKIYAGLFPHGVLSHQYPYAFYSDKVRWYDRTLEGVLFQVRLYGNSSLEAGIDWDSFKSGAQREKFMLFSSGKFDIYSHEDFCKWGIYGGYYATVYHHAGSEVVTGVMDNILVNPYLAGYWRSGSGKWNISARAGWLQAMQRDRKFGDGYLYPGGFYSEIEASWKWFGIRNTLYIGEDIMPYYDAADETGAVYGGGLYFGDMFYHTLDGVYNRLEAYWEARLGHDACLRLSTIHHYDGRKWGWQQLLTIMVKFDNNTKFVKKKKTNL